MNRIDPHRRPHYSPIERLGILELRAAETQDRSHREYPNHVWHVATRHEERHHFPIIALRRAA